jgi:hypothetical protein
MIDAAADVVLFGRARAEHAQQFISREAGDTAS